MGRKAPAARVWLTIDRALDAERTRFLVCMDKIAPHIAKELVHGSDARDVAAWVRRHHLGEWATEYALDRLRHRTGWIRILRAPLVTLDEALRSPPIYDPRIMRRATFHRKVELYVERVEKAAAEGGAVPTPETETRDLCRLVRWQVLGESAERIAGAEIAAGHKGKKRILAEEIRRIVKRLARDLVFPKRPRGKPGRPRKTPR